MKKTLCSLALLVGAAGSAFAADRPYAGFESREIKALSSKQINGLRAGNGMGMALAAELNNYPGPRHVLELSEQIGLSPVQRTRASELFDEMAAQAKRLGERVIEAEKRLDALFAKGEASFDTLRKQTAEIAELNGQLRFIHLRYHIEIRRLLSDAQIAHYGRLRGYRGNGHGHGHPDASRHGHGTGH